MGRKQHHTDSIRQPSSLTSVITTCIWLIVYKQLQWIRLSSLLPAPLVKSRVVHLSCNTKIVGSNPIEVQLRDLNHIKICNKLEH